MCLLLGISYRVYEEWVRFNIISRFLSRVFILILINVRVRTRDSREGDALLGRVERICRLEARVARGCLLRTEFPNKRATHFVIIRWRILMASVERFEERRAHLHVLKYWTVFMHLIFSSVTQSRRTLGVTSAKTRPKLVYN